MIVILKGIVIVLVLFATILQTIFVGRRRPEVMPASVLIRGVVGTTVMVFSFYCIITSFMIDGKVIMQASGLLVITVALGLRIWAQITLRRNWSVGVVAGSELVTSGPYRYLRHPMYDAHGLSGIGMVILTQSMLMLLIWGIFCILLFQRALEESRLLDGRFAGFRDWSRSPMMFFGPVYLLLVR